MRIILFIFILALASCSSCSTRQIPVKKDYGSTDSVAYVYDTTYSPRMSPRRRDNVTAMMSEESDATMSRENVNRPSEDAAMMPQSRGGQVIEEPTPTMVAPFIIKHNELVTPKVNKDYLSGLLVYDIPDTLVYRKWVSVKFRINRDRTDITITDNISETKIIGIKVSSVMELTLTDPRGAFSIVKSNADRQLVDTTDYTEWGYDIMPIKQGVYPLNIVISIIRNGDRKEIVFKDSVYVTAKFSQIISHSTQTFFEKYWQWMMSTLVIPFVIWIWNRKKKKRRAR